jgi:spore germination cell wall hydrolase CwlJ-like protein
MIVVCAVGIFYQFGSDPVQPNRQSPQSNNIVYTTETINYSEQDLKCLAKNVYYESGVEDSMGKLAVAQVTINRLKTGHWGKNICDVVYAPKQFSWTQSKQLNKINESTWYESMQVANNVLHGTRIKELEHSLYYHATYISVPKWVELKERVTQIGNHVFYNRAKDSWLSI